MLTDSVETSKKYKNIISRFTATSFENFVDLCPFNKQWNENTWADHLHTEWPDLVFLNPPYSKCPEFNYKALCEYKKGKNIAVLTLHGSTQI